MGFEKVDMNKIAALLVSLIEEQENVKIEYKFERKEEETA